MSRIRPLALPVAASVVVAFATAPSADAASRLVIRGAGFGHGVGMSQYGAMGFAKQGKTYRDILGHYYSGTSLGKLDADPTVRVLLQSGRSAVTFTGAAQVGDKRLSPTKTYKATTFAGSGVVVKTTAGKTVKTFASPVRIAGPGGAPWRLIGGSNSGTYRGALELRTGIGSGLSAVNAVTLESYVRGVISKESPASWPAEALKAQAVAARTYAITTNKSGAGFDHYADTRSQVYAGVAAETPTTDAAVAATAHEVVTYEGKPAVTYFFSTSGGKTENNETSALGGDPKPWLRSVEDPYDDESPKHRWGPIRLTMSQAGSKLRGLVKGSLRSIEVKKRGASPRIVAAEIVGSRGRTTVNGATLRARFGLNDSWAYFTVVGTEAEEDDTGTSTTGTGTDPGDGSGGATASVAGARRRGVVHGTITGLRRGTTIRIERRSAGGAWTTETTAVVRKSGRYRAPVARTGAYRVRAGSIVGPVARLR